MKKVRKELLLLGTDEDLLISFHTKIVRYTVTMNFAQSRAILDKDWIVLDNESTLYIYYNCNTECHSYGHQSLGLIQYPVAP